MEPLMRNRRQKQNSTRAKKSTHKAPTTIHEYREKSLRFQDIWNRVTHAVSKMRSGGGSLRQVAGEFGLTPRTVIHWGGPALRKRANGQYAAKRTDNLLRVLVILATDGLHEIAIRDSRQASLLAQYWAAVQNYLETGDDSALRKIRRKTITDADGKRFRLIKNLAELERLGSAGVLSFESLYAKAA
jgi:hypothetical protein